MPLCIFAQLTETLHSPTVHLINVQSIVDCPYRVAEFSCQSVGVF
ncbi:MAG: hypothetical protein ACI9FJ_002898 [Alteromonadaceae bacterium]|jgi:hypothetical protein